MSDPVFAANVYPEGSANPTIANARADTAPVGVCFSGGGSRALTCAWGQMIGLRTLRDGDGKSLLDTVRYISSVSGGTWASVLYTYLPESIPDDQFFPDYFAPDKLFLQAAPADGLDVSEMGQHALGQVPQNFANLFELNPFDNIIAEFISIVLARDLKLDESLKWLWMYIIGDNVLAPFNLYTYKFSFFRRGLPWDYPGAEYFSLSNDYAADHIFDKPEHPPADSFAFVNPRNRPMLIMNTNIVGEDCPNATMMGPIQIPVQVTPVSGGSFGSNPCVPDQVLGGGTVESFAFTSQLESPPSASEATASFPRRYSLVDIASTSSAFYAGTLAGGLEDTIRRMLESGATGWQSLINRILHRILQPGRRQRLHAIRDRAERLELSDLVPVYNYWPVSSDAGEPANTPTQFTDGGDLENTGVLGMLAQTDVATIVSFINTSVPLEKRNGEIIAAAQAAPLFGIAFDHEQHQFQPYESKGVNPFTNETDPKGFLQVFDNSNDEFNTLRTALFNANGAGDQRAPAFHKQALKVIDNSLAGVSARSEPVTVLWVQNARVEDWRTQIKDESLADAIETGQGESGDKEFAGFPYYNTFHKIHQTAAETNTLAQMWAWCVASDDSKLSDAIKELF